MITESKVIELFCIADDFWTVSEQMIFSGVCYK